MEGMLDMDDLLQDALMEDMLYDELDGRAGNTPPSYLPRARSSHSLAAPSQRDDELIAALDRAYAYDWHADQLRHETTHLERVLAAELARTQRTSNRSDPRRFAHLQRVDASRQWHETAKRSDAVRSAVVAAAMLRQIRAAGGDGSGGAAGGLAWTVEAGSVQEFQRAHEADAWRRRRAAAQGTFEAPLRQPTAVEQLFQDAAVEAEWQKQHHHTSEMEGTAPCSALDAAVDEELVSLLAAAEEETGAGAACAQREACSLMTAYLQCVMRVPPARMTDHARRITCAFGVSLGRHALGAAAAQLILAFRAVFSGAACQAADALRAGSVSCAAAAAARSGTAAAAAPRAAATVAGSEPLALWLRRATAAAAAFVVCATDALAARCWPRALGGSGGGSGSGSGGGGGALAAEALLAALLPHLPELPLLFHVVYRREDAALAERAAAVLGSAAGGSGSSGGSAAAAAEPLMARAGVPPALRLDGAAPTPDLLSDDVAAAAAAAAAAQERASARAYEPAVLALAAVQGLAGPREKGAQAVVAVEAICACVRRHGSGKSASGSLSADDLLPILSALVVMAYANGSLSHLRSQLEFVDALLPGHLKLGQTGYCQAMLFSAALDLTSDGASQAHAHAKELQQQALAAPTPHTPAGSPKRNQRDCHHAEASAAIDAVLQAFVSMPAQISALELQPLMSAAAATTAAGRRDWGGGGAVG